MAVRREGVEGVRGGWRLRQGTGVESWLRSHVRCDGAPSGLDRLGQGWSAVMI